MLLRHVSGVLADALPRAVCSTARKSTRSYRGRSPSSRAIRCEIPWLRRSPTAGAVLDGVNVASLALMAVVTWQLARAAVVDLPTVAMALVSLVLLLRYRVNSAWLVAGGALLGALLPR